MNPILTNLFRAALDITSAERSAFLDAQCSDPALRAQLDALLMVAMQTEQPLPVLDVQALAPKPIVHVDRSGELIGAFRLLSPLGSGGMGAVWLAERTAGFKQQVAIKWLHAGLSASARQRFARERETLAKLEHPGIARIVDGGSDLAADWFAMEFVPGLALDAYVKSTAASLLERIKLVLSLCDAVQYAHQNLIVHRDLKPSNILIGTNGQPKLLDFGVAKFLDDANQTISRAPMTFAYAAPEQIRGDAITTATDVYALGVILFELLTGERPHKPKGDGSLSLLQAITDTDATAPSSVVSLQTNRTIKPKQLKGDLDTIVLKALSRQPTRRYASAQALSEDLQRYLSGQPINARKESARYRFAKFVRRNKIATALAIITVIALIGGILTTSIQANRARIEAENARSDASRYQVVVSHIAKVFNLVHSEGDSLSTQKLFDWVSDVKLSLAEADAATEVMLKLEIANLLMNSIELPRALAMLDSALPQLASASPVVQLQARMIHARIYMRMARIDEAASSLDAAIILLPATPIADAASIQVIYGQIWRLRGRPDLGAKATRESVRLILLADGAPPRTVGGVFSNAASTMFEDDQLALATQYAEQAIAIWSQSGIGTKENLSGAQAILLSAEVARGNMQDALAKFSVLSPSNFVTTVWRDHNYARALALDNQISAALRVVNDPSALTFMCADRVNRGALCLQQLLAIADVALICGALPEAQSALKQAETAFALQPIAKYESGLGLMRARFALASAPSDDAVSDYLQAIDSFKLRGMEQRLTRRSLLVTAQKLQALAMTEMAARLASKAIAMSKDMAMVGGGMDESLLAIWQARIDGSEITPLMRANLAQAMGAEHPWVKAV